MTRHMPNHLSYPNDTSLEYRHPSRLPPTPPAPHDRSFALARSNPRTDPMSRQPSRPGPAPHVANSAAGTPRRRIPVACGRCRKRKIRCSGDPGDISGCNNCKQAGVGPGLCVFLRVQCEMRELVPDHVLMMDGYEQVSSATVDLHPYSSTSSTPSSSSSVQLLPHPMHSTLASQHLVNTHSMRVGGHNHGMHSNHAMSLKSLYHPDPMGGNSSGGDGNPGLLLTGSIGINSHRTHYDGLGGEMAGGVTHGSSSNGMSVGGGDIYSGNYPQYMHPDISQGMTNNAQHGHWAPIGVRQNPGLYMDQDQSTMGYMSATGPGTYPMVFPALTSLSSSLPDGISPRVNEKVQLPLPIRTQAPETGSIVNSRTSTTGTNLVSDPITPSYGTQSLQSSSYRGYASWGGDSSFSSTPQSASSISSTGIPALPAPSTGAYGSHNTFPLSASNSSLLPSTPHATSTMSNSLLDSFPTQSLPQKNRRDSESSSGSKTITPTQTPTMRANSTNLPYSPNYSRSTDANAHGTKSPPQRRTFSKVY